MKEKDTVRGRLAEYIKKLIEKDYGRLLIEKHDGFYYIEETDKTKIS